MRNRLQRGVGEGRRGKNRTAENPGEGLRRRRSMAGTMEVVVLLK